MARQISMANWPCLESLCLHGNALSNASIDKLAEGNWPLLRVLGVCYHWLKASAVNKLLSDQWPLIKMLELPGNRSAGQVLGWLCPGKEAGSWGEIMTLKPGQIILQRWQDLKVCSFLQLSTPERINRNLAVGESVLGLLV